MIAFICGSQQEVDWMMLRFAGATGTDMVFTTPHHPLGGSIAAYVVTDLAHKLAAGSPEFRDRLHRMIWHCEAGKARPAYGF